MAHYSKGVLLKKDSKLESRCRYAHNLQGVVKQRARIVMEELLGRELTKDEIVHHKDGDALNDDIHNLEVISRSKHTSFHNKDPKRLRGLKLCVDDVKSIKRMLRDGVSFHLIATIFGIKKPMINRIRNGAKWGWITI